MTPLRFLSGVAPRRVGWGTGPRHGRGGGSAVEPGQPGVGWEFERYRNV